MNNNRIQTTELDFDAIKDNLKNYLKGQSQFSDYDFEGSGISVLLDILAYNTHYNALYTNLAINEAFLDSASKRSSVVSKAKELGYVPLSAKSSTAVVDIIWINDQLNAPLTGEIPAYTSFNASVNGRTYTFYNSDTHVATRVGNQYTFPDVVLKEGTYLEYREVIDNTNKVVIPNIGVDTSTITVFVQDSSQSTTSDVFSVSTSILNLTDTSPVYFLKENEDQTYTVEFGNGVIGRPLANGNVVTVTYIVCNEDQPNGANTFTYGGTLPANTTPFVSTVSAAFGGSAAESLDAIKWNAPRMYAAQNRCVTADDYKHTILALYPGIKAISVWGGDESTPPQYGKVFISAVPQDTDFLTADQKQTIISDIINPRKPLAITPEFIDPTYVKIAIDVSFYYNPTLTTRTANDLVTIVRQTIIDYDTNNLNSFGDIFKFSRLSSLIDSSERSIISNIMTIKLHRDINPLYGISSSYTVKLGNPIYNSGVPEESILSTGFFTPDTSEIVYIEDQPVSGVMGNLRLFYVNLAGAKVYVRNVGTVNYSTGLINIVELNVTQLSQTAWSLTIKPQSNDVASLQDQFVEIDTTLLRVSPVVDTPTKNYTFTSSRN